MIVLFEAENSQYLAAVYHIETTKAELSRSKLELMRNNETMAAALANIDLYESNLSYLRSYARVISIAEYNKIKYVLATEYGTVTMCRRSLPLLEKHIANLESTIRDMEARLPSLKSKILEFRKYE